MKVAIAAIVGLWLAAGLQATAVRFSVFGASPDFVLILVTCLGLFTSRAGAAGIGFLGGLLQGAMVGGNLAAYVVSRSLTGFASGWIGSAELNKSVYVAPMIVAVATIAAQVVLLFIAPTHAIGTFLLATIGTSIYNGVVAVPVFAFLRRLLDPPRR